MAAIAADRILLMSVVFSLKLSPSIGAEMDIPWDYVEILLKQVGFLSDGVLDHSSLTIYIKGFTYLLYMVSVTQENRDAKEQTVQDMATCQGHVNSTFLVIKEVEDSASL